VTSLKFFKDCLQQHLQYLRAVPHRQRKKLVKEEYFSGVTERFKFLTDVSDRALNF
jgi:hypothetical protein